MSGLYLHIPFCRKRCTYCDFHFSTTFENYRADLITALALELSSRSNEATTIQSVYFGGGTPSILSFA
jgi:oxygen-independent coproporphyrinogen-3 oxidase